MLFPTNIGKRLSIDEVAVTNGELYTVLTNKAAHGKRGALVAMIESTKVTDIAPILAKIPLIQRNTTTEVTLDMAENMEAIVRSTFPRAKLVTEAAHGKRGALVAMIESTKVTDIAPILAKIPLIQRNTTTEVTLDMAENMEAIVRSTFPWCLMGRALGRTRW